MLRGFEKEIFDNWSDKEKILEIAAKEIIFRRKTGNRAIDNAFMEKVNQKLNTIYDNYKNEGPSVAPWFIIVTIEQIIRNGIK